MIKVRTSIRHPNRKASQGKHPNYELNIVFRMDPAVGFENSEFFAFKLLFPLCFMPRNPTMVSERGFNSFVCFTSFRYISMYVIYGVVMLIYVYIYVCMILNI